MTVVLPRPEFVSRDPALIVAEIVADFEARTGRTLHPADVERVLVDVVAYREALVRAAMQEAAEQNLVAFARFPMLDYLGELVGVARLPASPAGCTLRFTLTAAQAVPVSVPAGTRVQTMDGRAVFSTDAPLVVPAGALFADVRATAGVAGVAGNAYPAGAVSALLDPIAFVATVRNLAPTTGGAEREDDERLRGRIREAPNQYSVAGSAAAYRFHALSVSAEIDAVSVVSPAPGTVRVYVLAAGGIPSADLLAAVLAALSADTVRPLTDRVEVAAPDEVAYEIRATVRLLADVDPVATLAAVQAAAEAYAADRRAGLGRDVVPSQVVRALSVPGVYDVAVQAPAFRELAAHEWANCSAIVVTAGASARG